jgi:tetratricopeptide (TPR) repeat protein
VTARPFASTAGIILVAAALLAGAVELQAAREARYPPRETDPQVLYVRSGAVLRRLAGAYAPLVADAYWIRAIQYYGGNKLRLTPAQDGAPAAAAPKNGDAYALLYPMLDLATSLDPRFNIAYRFGAVFLSEAYPGGAGRPDQAIALLQKGLRARPDKWEYMQDIGFVHYWYDRDYRKAAEAFAKAAEAPGAPWWMRSLAATTLAKGGDRQSSRLMWEQIRQSAEIDWQRQDAERRLLQFRALDEIDALQRVVDDFSGRAGRPADWAVLVRAGVLRGTPLDPSRTPYELTPDGQVRLSPSSALGPLPAEPAELEARPPS